MKCTYCQKPVILVPSAAQRARMYGGTAAQYAKLFPNHSDCSLRQRSQEARNTIVSK